MKKKILLLLILLSLLIETPKRIDATSSIITTISGPSTGIVNQPLTYNLITTVPYRTNYAGGTDFSASWTDGYYDIDGMLIPRRFSQDLFWRDPSDRCTYNSNYTIANCTVTFTPTVVTMYRLGVSASDGTSYCSFTRNNICPDSGVGSYYNLGSCGLDSCLVLNVSNPQLTVNKIGSGTITSSPSGINCGTTCSHDYDYNTSVTLTATAATGYTFSSWSGDCSGTNATTTVTMDAAKTCTATFTSQPPTVGGIDTSNIGNGTSGTATRTSGLLSTEGGSNYWNTLGIKLNVTKQTNNIDTFLTAFYTGSAISTYNDIFAASRLNNGLNSQNGFLLAYYTNNSNRTLRRQHFFVYGNCNAANCAVNNDTDIVGNSTYGWVDLGLINNLNWTPIYNSSGVGPIFEIRPGRTDTSGSSGNNYWVSWEVEFRKALGSKTFKTGGIVWDTAGTYDQDFDITETPQ